MKTACDSLKEDLDKETSEVEANNGMSSISEIYVAEDGTYNLNLEDFLNEDVNDNHVFKRAHLCLEQLKSYDISMLEKLNKIAT